MSSRDDTPDPGVRVEPPVERARTYRAHPSPNVLRVRCGWGFRDVLLAVPMCGLACLLTLLLTLAAVDPRSSVPEVIYVALLFVGTASLALAYVCAALMLNHTLIVMGRRELSCSHGPLPWRARLVLPTDQVLEFEVEKRAAEDRSFVRESFDIVARTARGRTTLVSRLPGLRSALEATEELNRHLRA